MKKLLLTAAFGAVVLAVAPAAAAYKAATVTGGGSVHGSVQFTGSVPELPQVLIGKDNEVCGDGSVIPNPINVNGAGQLQDVVVFIEGIKSGKAWDSTEFALNQFECRFEPYVQVVKKGAELTIKNSDSVLHNVHPFEHVGDKRRTLFNFAQPNLNQVNSKKIKTRRGDVVELTCDAHNWMAGWLYVLEHPYFAVVGPDGSFEIGDIPAGDYTLKAWHPMLGLQEQAMTVSENGTSEVHFSFASQ